MTHKVKSIIGRAEFIDIVRWQVGEVPAKTDTGAYISAIHASNIKLHETNGETYLTCDVLTGHPTYSNGFRYKTPHFRKTIVQNSFGVSQERYAVKFKVKVAKQEFITEFTLANRQNKPFPVLLGRTLINRRFLVDTDLANVSKRKLKQKVKEWLKKDDQEEQETA